MTLPNFFLRKEFSISASIMGMGKLTAREYMLRIKVLEKVEMKFGELKKRSKWARDPTAAPDAGPG
jgi:hypothetical protein